MIPNIIRAIEPWLKEKVTEPRFWDGEYDTTHVGEYPLEPMNKEEQDAMFKRYTQLPHPFADKEVIVVEIGDKQ